MRENSSESHFACNQVLMVSSVDISLGLISCADCAHYDVRSCLPHSLLEYCHVHKYERQTDRNRVFFLGNVELNLHLLELCCNH